MHMCRLRRDHAKGNTDKIAEQEKQAQGPAPDEDLIAI